MRVVCAWCGDVTVDGTGPVSHGICPGCSFTVERAYHHSLLNKKQRAHRMARPRRASTLPFPGFLAPGASR